MNENVCAKTAILREALAFDLAHEFVFKPRHLHLRRKTGGLLCGRSIDGLEVTPYGGPGLCKDCLGAVPANVLWREPEEPSRSLSLQELSEEMNVRLHVTRELPDDSATGAAPAGAMLTSLNPPVLYVRCGKNGKLNNAQKLGALHELAHLLSAPTGFDCEIASGHYAVQYALWTLVSDGAPLRKATMKLMHNCKVFAGMMQTRARALGYLDGDLRLPYLRHLW